METVLDYYNPKSRTEVYSIITNQKTIKGKNEIELFEKFYKLNNSLRYCNGSYYKFQDKNLENKYQEWLKSDDYNQKSFDLYYGNGVVD